MVSGYADSYQLDRLGAASVTFRTPFQPAGWPRGMDDAVFHNSAWVRLDIIETIP